MSHIIVSDFLPLEIHKHLVLPLSSITFTANNQADNHFYKYIYLFQVLYSIRRASSGGVQRIQTPVLFCYNPYRALEFSD